MNGYYYTINCNQVVSKVGKDKESRPKSIELADSLEESIALALEMHDSSRVITKSSHFATIGFLVRKEIEGRILITY